MAVVPARAGGVLLHPTSLPGPHGIGDLGPEAARWVEWLAGAGCRLWQILPLGPTGFANSPYQSHSSFAGNPLLISLTDLQVHGLLSADDLLPLTRLSSEAADFERLVPLKRNLLAKAAAASKAAGRDRQEFEAFVESERTWLDDAALFLALVGRFEGKPWHEWPPGLAGRKAADLKEARRSLAAEVEAEKWKQFWFYRQWGAIRARAAEQGVSIIGDLPIYAAANSADTWAHPELFRLDSKGRPLGVAGVPPDYFSATGQLWGNPVYAWERHTETGYAWWTERVRAGLRTVDILRIDHFRGLQAYWEVPAGRETAEVGEWVEAPGSELLETLRTALGDLPLLAEDLGVITPEVVELRRAFGLPGMRILQFGLEGGPQSLDLPHNYEPLTAAYTGTHDNDTSRGWYEVADEATRHYARRYLAADDGEIVPAMVRALWSSVAGWTIVPMQDVLQLGSEARMNRPGTAEGNWGWRMTGVQWKSAPTSWLEDLSRVYGRSG
jgi:4-alpha-glucanotransferase